MTSKHTIDCWFAFPQPFSQSAEGGVHWAQPGMSLRDWFAGQALAHPWTNVNLQETPEEIAEDAFRIADAMLAARKGVQS